MTTTNYEASYIYAVVANPAVLSLYPVEPALFTDQGHRAAHELARDMESGDGFDLVAFGRAHPSGARYIHRLTTMDNPVSAHIAADGMATEHKRRVLGNIATELLRGSRDHLEPVEATCAAAMDRLKNLTFAGNGVATLADTMRVTMKLVEATHNAGGRIGIETGFDLLDRIICGWEPGKLYFIAARPKAGKTAFALSTTTHALSKGARVYFASREMGQTQLGMRLLSAEARVDSMDIRRAQFNDAAFGKLTAAMGRLAKHGRQCLIDDRPRVSWEKLQSTVLQEHTKDPLGLVVVDYVQLLRMENREENRAAELETIAYGLKDLAKELDVPVIALSQLNREQDENKPPTIDRMKGSGGLEQAADAVVLLWRPDQKNPDTIEIVVGANRDGPTGKFRAAFLPEYASFE